jgi:hypothetical protein
MKKSMQVTVLICLSLIAAAGCTADLPYLSLTVSSLYTSSSISIPYEFRSEQSEQPCRISLQRVETTGNLTDYDNREDWYQESGTLHFDGLDPGNYQLRFVVLSARGSNWVELPYLDQTHYFTVNY